MSEHKKNKKFLPKPIYPGGTKALREFIGKEMKYPKEARINKIEGIVRVRIDINYKGKVVDTTILKTLGHGCDEEADRLVRLMKWQISDKIRKGKILFHKTMNIHFKLPLPKPQKAKPGQTQLTYSITPGVTSVEKKSPQPATQKSYTYTIRY